MEAKQQKLYKWEGKSMVNKKVVIICTIIALIVVASIVAIKIGKLEETEPVEENIQGTAQNVQEAQNTIKNEVEEQETIEEPNKENEVTVNETTAENKATTQNEIQGEEETKETEGIEEENTTEKALKLVKEEWGEDDTVYYTIDNQSNNIFNISVRSKETTATLTEYEVDVKEEKVTMK